MNRLKSPILLFLLAAVKSSFGAIISSGFTGNIQSNGNIVMIKAKDDPIAIERFDVEMRSSSPAPFEVWFLPDISPGFLDSQQPDYTLVFQGDIAGQGWGTPTPLPNFSSPVIIPAGATYSFYITVTGSQSNLWYKEGQGTGSIIVQDQYIELIEGYAVRYQHASYFANRIWSGNIYYSVVSQATGSPSLLPSLSPTASSPTTSSPTEIPTDFPTESPVNTPTRNPQLPATLNPSMSPTGSPDTTGSDDGDGDGDGDEVAQPSLRPSMNSVETPTIVTPSPTRNPQQPDTLNPSTSPSGASNTTGSDDVDGDVDVDVDGDEDEDEDEVAQPSLRPSMKPTASSVSSPSLAPTFGLLDSTEPSLGPTQVLNSFLPNKPTPSPASSSVKNGVHLGQLCTVLALVIGYFSRV